MRTTENFYKYSSAYRESQASNSLVTNQASG